MSRSETTLKKRKETLARRVESHLDFLMGSVVAYRLKCSKHCRCNQGKGHVKFYVSTSEGGRTRNRYLPKDLVKEARRRTRTYTRLKELLRELSQVNYELLRATGPARTGRKK